MKKITANIVKGFVGRLPVQKQAADAKKISWLNEKILKHQGEYKIKSFSFGRFIVFYRRPYELLHTYNEIFIRGIYQFESATPAPLIIDCGSNIGLSVLNFKMQYPHARIMAFEPDDDNFELLKKNIEANNLTEVLLYKKAVWIQDGTISFTSGISEASHISEEVKNTKQVASQRLADIIASQKEVDFLKIDIEGAEWPVLKDCASQLFKVQNLFLEYHGKTNETNKLNEIIDIIQESGFNLYIQNAADNLIKPFLNKTTDTIYDVQLNLYCFKK